MIQWPKNFHLWDYLNHGSCGRELFGDDGYPMLVLIDIYPFSVFLFGSVSVEYFSFGKFREKLSKKKIYIYTIDRERRIVASEDKQDKDIKGEKESE